MVFKRLDYSLVKSVPVSLDIWERNVLDEKRILQV